MFESSPHGVISWSLRMRIMTCVRQGEVFVSLPVSYEKLGGYFIAVEGQNVFDK